TTPSPSDNYTFTLTTGQTATGKDFANTQLVSISGTKYRDITGNGLTADDTVLGGTTTYLDPPNTGPLRARASSRQTAAHRGSSFADLTTRTHPTLYLQGALPTRTTP